jgi:hypothetical protein
MTTTEFFREIRQKVSNDQLEESIDHLRFFIENNPSLIEFNSQSNRFNKTISKLKREDLDFEYACILKSELRKDLLDLIKDLELKSHKPEIKNEMREAISIATSKNVVVGSSITANDVHIGDVTTYSESKLSKRLRVFLFVFVPLIVIISAYLYYQLKVMSQPLNMKVLIENKTPNENLPDPIGTLTISYGGEMHEKKEVTYNAMFENIPSKFKKEKMQLKYKAQGFVSIDTVIDYIDVIKIDVSRNDYFGLLKGYVYEENKYPLVGLANVKVSVNCCSTLTDESGHFNLEIPFEFQQKKQRVEFFKEGFYQKSTIEPVMKNVELQTYLIKM